MFKTLIFALLAALIAPLAAAQEAPHGTRTDTTMIDAYRVFRPDGQPATLDDVVAAMADADVVFVGEQHDDPVGHHLEATLLAQAYLRYRQTRPVALSLEMIERDVQPILDEYLSGIITEQHFLKSSRPWNNYETDYKPLVEFAKAHRLPVIAANAPRRYVNRVSRLGAASLDSLSAWARAWLPPLPYPGPSPAYEARWNQMMAEMMAEYQRDAARSDSAQADTTGEGAAADAMGEGAAALEEASAEETAAGADAAASGMHGNTHMLDAQACWDASMADAIRRYLERAPDALVLHMVGSFHVEAGLGIPAQLAGYRPGTRSLVVFIQDAEDFNTFDPGNMGDLGDFVVLTDQSLPRSFHD